MKALVMLFNLITNFLRVFCLFQKILLKKWFSDLSTFAWKRPLQSFLKGELDKYNIINQLFHKKVEIFIPLEMLILTF